MRHIVLCIDQSGSMAASVVYSAIFGAVLATLPAVSTSLVVFDTAVVDLTDGLDDPIDVLFSTRLGGGTDINRAVAYCQTLVRAPHETIFVLISDLYEGGVEAEFMKRAATLVASGIQFVTLLALSDEGSPSYNAQLAGQLATLGVPAFACTPDKFPELMAAAIQRADLRGFAAAAQAGDKR
jgi:Mg-chelatase subunit ChlD